MKKKLLIFTLCFTLIFSSINYKKSYAFDGGMISLPVLGVVCSVAVGTGIALNNSDDLYNIGRAFCDYIDSQNDLTMDTVNALFASSVSILNNNKVSVGTSFMDILIDFFKSSHSSKYYDFYGYFGLLPVYSREAIQYRPNEHYIKLKVGGTYELFNDFKVVIGDVVNSSGRVDIKTFYKGVDISKAGATVHVYDSSSVRLFGSLYSKSVSILSLYCLTGQQLAFASQWSELCYDNISKAPDVGHFDESKIKDKIENGKVSLPVPGNLDKLLGQTSDDFWSNTDGLVGNGDISIPSVDNPSVSIGGSTTFPGSSVGDSVDSPSVPGAGIWAQIRDFVVSLVVPSDTFWTDTWGGLYNSFTSSFPMVDMDNFNKLVTNEKKFPNIDINIMGVSGRVVNGDVINSIVDWLRPIIAGFMMLCLMFFNYRKIYKLIRNTEPFGGIAPGNTSDIKTGISEYSKHEVVKATDMVAEYHAWKERGGK